MRLTGAGVCARRGTARQRTSRNRPKTAEVRPPRRQICGKEIRPPVPSSRDMRPVLSRGVRALAAAAFLVLVVRTAWLSDDALISLRTVLNVTHGFGLTFNVAERVQTFTHPAWLLEVTVLYGVIGNVYYATFAAAILTSLVAFWLVLRGAASPVQAWMAAGLLFASRAFIDFSTSG